MVDSLKSAIVISLFVLLINNYTIDDKTFFFKGQQYQLCPASMQGSKLKYETHNAIDGKHWNFENQKQWDVDCNDPTAIRQSPIDLTLAGKSVLNNNLNLIIDYQTIEDQHHGHEESEGKSHSYHLISYEYSIKGHGDYSLITLMDGSG